MTLNASAARVVVGLDESDAGLAAARWAAAEAAHRHAELHLVRVQTCNPSSVALAPLCACAEFTDPDWAADVVNRAVREVRTAAPDLPVTGEVIYGNVVAGLLAAARQSQLLVLGSHTVLSRSFARSHSCVPAVASKAPVPVVLVRPFIAGSHPTLTASGLVVVLTDATTGIGPLVDYGCAQAERQRAEVDVITVIKPPRRRRENAQIAAEHELFDALMRCRARWPAAHLAGRVSSTKADAEIRSRLSRAQLVIVKSNQARSLMRRRKLASSLMARSRRYALTVVPD